jgi:IS605 OrfB family transposase
MIQVIHAQIYASDFSSLELLASRFCSCARYCFNRFLEGYDFNAVRNLAKRDYVGLNTRQISDACLQGQTSKSVFASQQESLEKQRVELEENLKKVRSSFKRRKLQQKIKLVKRRLRFPKLVFGGRKLLNLLKAGTVTKKQWKDKRDGQVYARGDATKKGNPNIRVVGDNLRITVGNRKFVNYKLFVPEKFHLELVDLLLSGKAYNVRLKKQDDHHWEMIIDYEQEEPMQNIGFSNGAIGVDVNVDRVAVSNVTKDGNLVESFTLVNSRLKDGSEHKRLYDIAVMVKQVITYAKEQQKGIIFENLKFKKEWTWNKKLNRIKSNFVWRKFLELLERKCIENGIQHKKVNPAYTSLIGRTKYSEMYGLTVHEAASFVIARRGLGFNEKLSIYKVPAKVVKERTIRTLEGKYDGKRIHNWVLWSRVKAVLTGLKNRMRTLQEVRDYFFDDSEILSGEVFLQQLVVGSSGLTT